MKVQLIDVMGDDLRVANAARVSFDKESEWEHEREWDPSHTFYMEYGGDFLSLSDQKLIAYLAKHNHWTPFSHVMITMRETVPIFVARQRFKHMVGFTYNEISRRYVDDTPEFYFPDEWRSAPTGNKKQGSGDGTIEEFTYEGGTFSIDKEYKWLMDRCLSVYTNMIEAGVAPEQARMVLPQSMYTSYYVTGSLAAWSRAYRLRSDPHAQLEIRNLAEQWREIISGIVELRYSWQALTS